MPSNPATAQGGAESSVVGLGDAPTAYQELGSDIPRGDTELATACVTRPRLHA
jgi:hypothetical protein